MEEVLIDGGHLVPQHGVEMLNHGRIACMMASLIDADGIPRGCKPGRAPTSTAWPEPVEPDLRSV
ncbi:MAG TPA: hypothetical protein VJ349_00825, partial [Stellaceae bacterium]|nr:hypothetical protein [Stellaceae bacterium]